MGLIKKVQIMKLRYEKTMSSFVFKEPTRRVQENYIRIDNNVRKLENLMKTKQENEKAKYSELVAKLDAYSPLKTLARGYAITQKEGKVIKTKAELKSGDMVDIRLTDGEVKAQIQ